MFSPILARAKDCSLCHSTNISVRVPGLPETIYNQNHDGTWIEEVVLAPDADTLQVFSYRCNSCGNVWEELGTINELLEQGGVT